ncbi:MAG: amidoligase family protein [Bacilli bacterium]
MLQNLNIHEIKELDQAPFTLRNTLNIPSHISFGIEIEFEEAMYNIIQLRLNEIREIRKWQLTIDNSIYNNNLLLGGEIISPICYDEKKTWQELKTICTILKNNRAQANFQSGGHIHLGSQILGNDVQSWINFVKIWIVYEKVIFKFGYGIKKEPRPFIETTAGPISLQLHYIINKQNQLKELNKLDYLTFIDLIKNKKHQAINFNNINDYKIKKDNTVELRSPNGSIEEIIIQNNINFFSKLFLYCKSKQFNYDKIEQKMALYDQKAYEFKRYNEENLEEALELSEMIFDNKLDKMYFLKQYLKMGSCFHDKPVQKFTFNSTHS